MLKPYYKVTLYTNIVSFFLLFCWVAIARVNDILNGEIYNAITNLILALLLLPILLTPLGVSLIFSYLLYQQKRKNLFAAWILSLTVVPVSIIEAVFFRFPFEPLYIVLSPLLLVVAGIGLFNQKIKWVISILFLYALYLFELFLAE